MVSFFLLGAVLRKASMGLMLVAVNTDSNGVRDDITMATFPPLRPSVAGVMRWQRGLSFSTVR